MREYITNLAVKLQGIPYCWGGSNPMSGFDCSGFVIWILQTFDILPSGDWTAADLERVFLKTDEPDPGDLVFYGQGHATHVMMYLGTLDGLHPLCIGASGGDSSTLTIEDARTRGAKVKIKDVHYRKDFRQYGKII